LNHILVIGFQQVLKQCGGKLSDFSLSGADLAAEVGKKVFDSKYFKGILRHFNILRKNAVTKVTSNIENLSSNQKDIVVTSNSLSIDILSIPPGLSKIDQIKLYKEYIFWLESKLMITKKRLAFEEA
jgi:hypothetical protein